MTTSFKMYLVRDRAVSYYAASQSGGVKTLQIKDPNGSLLVDTTILSTSLSNFSVGNFEAQMDGEYTVDFPDCNDVRQDQATLTNERGETVVQTNQFAGEDGSDGDYNDIFAAISWYMKEG